MITELTNVIEVVKAAELVEDAADEIMLQRMLIRQQLPTTGLKLFTPDFVDLPNDSGRHGSEAEVTETANNLQFDAAVLEAGLPVSGSQS